MRRWYQDKYEAVHAASKGGWRLWEIQQIRVKGPDGNPQWYLNTTLPKTLSDPRYRCTELDVMEEWKALG